MTQRDTSGPAFPHVRPQPQNFVSYHPGMSLRDWYAGQALSSIPLRSWDYLSAEDDKVRAWATLAYAVADAMLAARSPAQEGGEADPAAAARLAEIARIIEDVDNRCLAADGPVTKTRHEMTDDEMRKIYQIAKEGASATPQPDPRDELLREARDALDNLLSNYDAERAVIDAELDPGCSDCTMGATPDRFNNGPCALHSAETALRKLQEVVGDE